VESLERRDCPAAPVISGLTVTPISAYEAEVSGHVSDENPATAVVCFDGVIQGAIEVNPDGSFAYLGYVSGPGEVRAVAYDEEMLESLAVAAELANQAPQIVDFSVSCGAEGFLLITGRILDESPGGMEVWFGGLSALEGVSVTVDEEGYFSLSIQVDPHEEGTITAITYDAWGVASNEAWWLFR
jgi:hypothetical protein